jgi:hypothetical protein
MINQWETVHTAQVAGFDIELAMQPETYQPDWEFHTEAERQQLLEDIDSGNMLWFAARVTASKAGVVLSKDYLGGCCYESIEDFMEPGGYYTSMLESAIEQARDKLAELTAKE